jgi:hypothetical protein
VVVPKGFGPGLQGQGRRASSRHENRATHRSRAAPTGSVVATGRSPLVGVGGLPEGQVGLWRATAWPRWHVQAALRSRAPPSACDGGPAHGAAGQDRVAGATGARPGCELLPGNSDSTGWSVKRRLARSHGVVRPGVRGAAALVAHNGGRPVACGSRPAAWNSTETSSTGARSPGSGEGDGLGHESPVGPGSWWIRGRRASSAASSSAAANASAASGLRSPSASGRAWCSHTRSDRAATVQPPTTAAGRYGAGGGMVSASPPMVGVRSGGRRGGRPDPGQVRRAVPVPTVRTALADTCQQTTWRTSRPSARSGRSRPQASQVATAAITRPSTG